MPRERARSGRHRIRGSQSDHLWLRDESAYLAWMDLIFGLLLLIVTLAILYDLMKRAMFSALEQHAKNMAIREGTYDPERWQG